MAGMHDDVATLRRAILALDATKQRRRYPPSLRARLASFVRAHPQRSTVSLARALDMAPQTLERIVATTVTASLVPVRVVDDPVARAEVRVFGPRGIVVEGLDVGGVAALIKALS
jgi:transposase-like protein